MRYYCPLCCYIPAGSYWLTAFSYLIVSGQNEIQLHLLWDGCEVHL